MGGPRASTQRQIDSGKICANCRRLLDLRPSHERLCEKCSGKRHRVYLHFMLSDGWFCQFLEEDLKTPLPRKLRLDDPAKIVEMAEKGGAAMRLEDRQALDYGIKQGRGSVWLNLTQDQYEKLKRPAARANPLQRR
jgi:hypothetical protein